MSADGVEVNGPKVNRIRVIHGEKVCDATFRPTMRRLISRFVLAVTKVAYRGLKRKSIMSSEKLIETLFILIVHFLLFYIDLYENNKVEQYTSYL